MKKLLSLFAAFLLAIGFANTAFSAEIKDVPANYWAAKEINAVVNDGVMNTSNGIFAPEKDVTRAQFNSMLLRALGHKAPQLSETNKFKDVAKNHWAYGDILMSQQLGLIYGYPDKTFRPENVINKSEAASIISHITKDTAVDMNVLTNFKDSKDIPAWAKTQYAKSIGLNIYVNYPDAEKLLPVKVLNRAEAAVLLYKLQASLNMVSDKYLAKEVLVATEHLNVYKDAASNEVKITNFRKVVVSGNVLKAYFAEPFNSKNVQVGQAVTFVLPEDLCTQEGTLVLPRKTQIIGYIQNLVPQQKFNKNAEVTILFTKVVLPSCKQIGINGKVLNDKDGVLSASKLATAGKVAAYTAGGAAIGAGAGAGFAAIPNPKNYAIGSAAIGLPVGAGVGLVTGFVTPGLAFKADENDFVYVLLNSDLSIPLK
ncbi:MAG: S-layer homology domain-containing protein [Candidatus Gastranaerophilales bacterium]|nr:S-layer homology domain-containing protein [Candidatus Gastranaerophilales bacterium]